jgi:hypothetical protein
MEVPTLLRAGVRGRLLRAAGGGVLPAAGSVLRTRCASEGLSALEARPIQILGLLVIPTFQPGVPQNKLLASRLICFSR